MSLLYETITYFTRNLTKNRIWGIFESFEKEPTCFQVSFFLSQDYDDFEVEFWLTSASKNAFILTQYKNDHEYGIPRFDGSDNLPDFWTRGLERIRKIQELQGIFIEEYEENKVRIREMFNQMLRFAEKYTKRAFETMSFDENIIEKQILKFREKRYGSENRYYLKGEIQSQKKINTPSLHKPYVNRVTLTLFTKGLCSNGVRISFWGFIICTAHSILVNF